LGCNPLPERQRFKFLQGIVPPPENLACLLHRIQILLPNSPLFASFRFHSMDSDKPSLDALRIDRTARRPAARASGTPWMLIAGIAILAVSTFLWFYRPKGIEVQVATVRAQTSTTTSATGRTVLNASGYVTTRRQATVSSKVTGKVVEILVEEGQKVEAGQILARLDASNVEAGLRLAEAQLESSRMALAEVEPMLRFTELELERLSKLAKANGASDSEFRRAEAEAKAQVAKLARQKSELAVAERQIDTWKQQIDDTVIRAPFAGVVTTKDSQPGEMISPMSSGGFTRTGICTLVDMASLEIEVDVNESYINRVEPDATAEAILDAYPEWRIPAKVIAIIPTADRQKATVKVRVAFEKLDPRILPEMGVKVAFQGGAGADNNPPGSGRSNLVVPKSAVQQKDGKDIAWVVRNDRVERRAITIANGAGEDSVISAGLTTGEVVVVNPSATLSDGAAVRVTSSL
jgi:HlyD family secretion protein